MAAWGDVARRIAHEVKNPLTPIQLSAERLRRKFGPMVGEERPALEQYADVIVRQTNDLRRIVDEFSKFARMPAPERKPLDLGKLIGEAVVLQEAGHPDMRYRVDLPEPAVLAHLDGTMINQAFTNLLKNAAEAIEERLAKDPARARARSAWRWRPTPEQLDHRHPGQRHRPARPAGAAVRALRHPPRQGHRPRPADRQEDHRGARRHARSGAGAALRRKAPRPAPGRGSCCRRRCRAAAGKATRRARSPRS